MNNILQVSYQQTGKSTTPDSYGMREMQARAFAQRNSRHLLLKAPPASGKSRALMFLALDKLNNQGVRKAIVAVPEKSIGGSFQNTHLTDGGFFADWIVSDENNLCFDGGEDGKVIDFQRFIHGDGRILICTHATLRYAFDKIDISEFNQCLVAIDEFHHVSADGDNRLGNLVSVLMNHSSAHIIAMTGSYFRGDSVPVLLPEDEAKFTQVTYTYYEQLNGYQYLKSLGIGYHFYQGRYTDALPLVLDVSKKTLIHIPNVNSGESSKDKHGEVDAILDLLGKVEKRDSQTGVYFVSLKAASAKGQRAIKVANLVDDNPRERGKIQRYLSNMKSADDMDIIIALGMAKEGFDWPYCEHVLTIGYRSSLTEIVQIIGRATRDCQGKQHAQFTNLIAEPDASNDDVANSVNTMLKAISASLLMEQILAPNICFKPRSQWDGETPLDNTILINDSTPAGKVSKKVLDVLNGDSNELRADLIGGQDQTIKEAVLGVAPAEIINQGRLPFIIAQRYPDLTDEEVEQVREGLVFKNFINQQGGLLTEKALPEDADIVGEGNNTGNGGQGGGGIIGDPDGGDHSTAGAGRQFIKMGEKFISIDDLSIDLIDSINPFQKAYEIISKSITAPMLNTIQQAVINNRSPISEQEAVILWPEIKAFTREYQREPLANASDPIEARYGQALAFLRMAKRKKIAAQHSDQ